MTCTIPAEGSQTFEVVFTGSGQKIYEQKVCMDIQGRDPADQPQGVQYDVVAESCIPGISTDQYESIFEEQVTLTINNKIKNTYYMHILGGGGVVVIRTEHHGDDKL